jgi:RNA polymerase primary sigma factor
MYSEALLPAFYSAFMERTPLLTKEEEDKLSKDVLGKSEAKKKKAIEKLVESNLRLVVKIAMSDFYWFADKQDIISEGMVGLQKAASKYDSSFGARFSTYAAFYIRQWIHNFISRNGLVHMTRYTTTSYASIQKIIQKLKEDTGKEPTTEEIADSLGMKKERVEEILGFKFSYVPMDSPFHDDQTKTLADVLRDENAVSPDMFAEQNSEFEQVPDLLDVLNEREKLLIRKRFGFDGEEPMILEDIGEIFKVTRERARQIQEIALKKIRNKMKKKQSSLLTA